MTSETPENPIQITDCIKTKLCLENYKENYPRWEREIFDVLHGHGLLEYFFATNLPSLPADGTPTVEIERWKTKDKVIWNWLFSTLPPDTRSNLGQLAHETTNLLWQSLRVMYSTDPLPSEFNLEDLPFIAKTSTRPSRTPENPTIPHTSSTSENPIQITRHIHTTLNLENFKENYPRWEEELFEVLADCGLLSYLDGTFPSTVLSNGFINVEFEYWQKQDQIIWDWLYSSLPPVIRSNVRRVAHESSHMLWNCLTSMYKTDSFSSVVQLKLQLQTIKKDNASTCAQYLDQIQQIADRLRSLGDDLSEQDLVLYTLLGLDQDFENFVSVHTSQKTLPHLTMAKLKRLLCVSTTEKDILDSMAPTNLTSVLYDDSSFFPDTDTDQTHLENSGGHPSLNLNQIFDGSYQKAPSSSQQVFPLPLLSPSEAEDLNNFVSDYSIPDIDQTHVEIGAGLGAEDSDIARWLLQNTTLLPLQTWDPAAGGQVMIISDDEEDAD